MLGTDVHTPWLADKPGAAPRPAKGPSALVARAPEPGRISAAASSPPSNADPSAPTAADAPAGGPAKASAGMTEDGKVILNLATVEDLRHLPGVGPKRADAILVLRARLGRFRQVNDLLRVKGIGVRGLKKILPHVVLDPPKPSA